MSDRPALASGQRFRLRSFADDLESPAQICSDVDAALSTIGFLTAENKRLEKELAEVKELAEGNDAACSDEEAAHAGTRRMLEMRDAELATLRERLGDVMLLSDLRDRELIYWIESDGELVIEDDPMNWHDESVHFGCEFQDGMPVLTVELRAALTKGADDGHQADNS
jgi:hypothetical protein